MLHKFTTASNDFPALLWITTYAKPSEVARLDIRNRKVDSLTLLTPAEGFSGSKPDLQNIEGQLSASSPLFNLRASLSFWTAVIGTTVYLRLIDRSLGRREFPPGMSFPSWRNWQVNQLAATGRVSCIWTIRTCPFQFSYWISTHSVTFNLMPLSTQMSQWNGELDYILKPWVISTPYTHLAASLRTPPFLRL